MCNNCSPYRDSHAHHSHWESQGRGHSIDTFPDRLLETPISRGTLLKAVGGGLTAALTAGALGWNGVWGAGPSLPYVVLIVLDGARREYLDIPGIPRVQSLIRNGTQYSSAFAGILESETPSGHVSIATGSEPRKTGVPSFWWATDQNVQFSLFSPDRIRAGELQRIIRRSGVPTLAGRVHSRSRNAKVVALSGSKYYAADAIGGPEADITMYFQTNPRGQWTPTSLPGHTAPASVLNASGLTYKNNHLPLGVQNHLAMNLAAQTFKKVRQQVTLINLPEFDWPLGHNGGGIIDPQGVKTLMQGFDRDLAALQDVYRKAGVLDRTVFVLMADHGMMPLRHKVSQDAITSAVAKSGTSIVSQAYTSGSYLWLKDGSRAGAAAQNIAHLNNPHIQSVYARVRTARGYSYHRASSSKLLRAGGIEGANQYLLNSFNGSNAPDVVVVFTEGTGCEPGGQAGWKGDHGGASWQAQQIPLVLSGPGIRAGHTSSFPARLIDVAPTILQLMGVSHAGMQGLPLADALKGPPAWALAAQKAASKALIPVVSALQQESHAELAASK